MSCIGQEACSVQRGVSPLTFERRGHLTSSWQQTAGELSKRKYSLPTAPTLSWPGSSLSKPFAPAFDPDKGSCDSYNKATAEHATSREPCGLSAFRQQSAWSLQRASYRPHRAILAGASVPYRAWVQVSTTNRYKSCCQRSRAAEKGTPSMVDL